MLDLACDIRNELTNAVQTTFTKARVVHTKIFCVRNLNTLGVQSRCTKTVEQSWFLALSFFVDLARKILQHQIRMPAVALATLRTGIYKTCFYCKLYLTYHG